MNEGYIDLPEQPEGYDPTQRGNEVLAHPRHQSPEELVSLIQMMENDPDSLVSAATSNLESPANKEEVTKLLREIIKWYLDHKNDFGTSQLLPFNGNEFNQSSAIWVANFLGGLVTELKLVSVQNQENDYLFTINFNLDR